MSKTSGNDWRRDHGPDRPFWEPVRLVDFDGERLGALRQLRQDLRGQELGNMQDQDLAMRAILDMLFTQGTVTAAAANAETIRLATQALPAPEGRKWRKLSSTRRDELIMLFGDAWSIFTRPNFPLPPTPQPEA